jgi:hypothetical protein
MVAIGWGSRPAQAQTPSQQPLPQAYQDALACLNRRLSIRIFQRIRYKGKRNSVDFRSFDRGCAWGSTIVKLRRAFCNSGGRPDCDALHRAHRRSAGTGNRKTAGQSEIVSNAGQPNAWIASRPPNRPCSGRHVRGAHRESRVRSIRMRDSTIRSSARPVWRAAASWPIFRPH